MTVGFLIGRDLWKLIGDYSLPAVSTIMQQVMQKNVNLSINFDQTLFFSSLWICFGPLSNEGKTSELSITLEPLRVTSV